MATDTIYRLDAETLTKLERMSDVRAGRVVKAFLRLADGRPEEVDRASPEGIIAEVLLDAHVRLLAIAEARAAAGRAHRGNQHARPDNPPPPPALPAAPSAPPKTPDAGAGTIGAASYLELADLLDQRRCSAIGALARWPARPGVWSALVRRKGERPVALALSTKLHEFAAGEVPRNEAAVIMAALKQLPDAGIEAGCRPTCSAVGVE